MAMMNKAQREVVNADRFKRIFGNIHLAAVAVTVIRTREPYRAIETLLQFAFTERANFKAWNVLRGWETYDQTDLSKSPVGDGKKDIGQALAALGGSEMPEGFYAMLYPHPYIKASIPVVAMIKEYAKSFAEGQKRLALVVPPGFTLPPELEDDLTIIDFDTPSHRELADCLDRVLSSISEAKRPRFNEEDRDRLLAAAAGLTAHEAEAAFSRALVENKAKLPHATAEDLAGVILSVKVEAVRKTDILEVMPAESMSNVGGLANLKEWVRKRARCFSDEARAFGIEPPKGMLLVGPPGTGKSLTAKAVAKEMGLPLIKFDVSRVFAGIVGESEARVRSALKMIEGMSPCVVLIDEVDKALGGVATGGGDSGVSKRVLGAILTWMQETTAPVFNVLSANRVDALPAELLRRGRLDEVFSVSVPNAEERLEILRIHLSKRGKNPEEIEGLEEAATGASEGYVPAEIECAVKDAIIEAFTSDVELTGQLIVSQFANMVPLSQAFAEDFAAMQTWAENNARPASRSTEPRATQVRQRTRQRPGVVAPPVVAGPRSIGIDG
jgi:SpoVK/Ycf46/Vps4 family AAA+-type ATPase